MVNLEVYSYMTQHSSTKGDLFKSRERGETTKPLLLPIKGTKHTFSASLFYSAPFCQKGSLLPTPFAGERRWPTGLDLTIPFSSHVSNHVNMVFVSLTSKLLLREFQALNWVLALISQSQVAIKTGHPFW